MQRVAVPLILLGLAIVLAVTVASAGGGSDAAGSTGGGDDGSAARLVLTLLLVLISMTSLAAQSILAKVEIDQDRVRVTSLLGFREVSRSSVTGLARRQGKQVPQRLVLAEGSQVVKHSRLRPGARPTWDEADHVDLPAVSIDDLSSALALPHPPTTPRFEGPDLAEVRRDVGTMFWHDGRPGYFLYAVAIAVVLIVVCIVAGTTSGTGPLNGSP